MDLRDLPQSIYPENDTLSCHPEGALAKALMISRNFPLDIFNNINEALLDCPVEDVRIKEYASAVIQKRELHDMLVEWHKKVTSPLVLPLWLMNGTAMNEEEAKNMLRVYLNKVDEMRKMGAIFGMPLATLVARKEGHHENVSSNVSTLSLSN